MALVSREHKPVVLTEDLPQLRLQAGDVGVVVHVYAGEQAFEVEFLTLDGETAAVATLTATQVRPVRKGEIPHARGLPVA